MPDSDFERLMAKLLDERPEVSRSDVEQNIKEKKEKIGAGYLTDQGALFLIASDLNVSLSDSGSGEIGLKDLFAGARDVTVTARLMSSSPAKQFTRKDGTAFFLRTMIVYDDRDRAATVKLWDEKANLPGVGDLRPGDLVRFTGAAVKADIDGSPTISVGSGSDVEIPSEESGIPPIGEITVDIGQVSGEKKNIAVSGLMDGDIGTMQFTSSSGRPGKALRMRLRGKDGGEPVRVVIWGKDEADLPAMIGTGSKARLLGVRSKQANQGLEVHGNESTTIEVEGSKATAVKFRILSSTRSEQGPSMLFGVDAGGKTVRVKDPSGITNAYGEGDTIECMPVKAHGSMITLGGEASYAIKADGEFPTIDKILTKIGGVSVGAEGCCVKAIVLSISDRREIQTKSGEQVPLGEMLVEDQTGQIMVKGWRQQARLVDACALGDIIQVTDLSARAGLEGRTDLVLGPYSRITKVDS